MPNTGDIQELEGCDVLDRDGDKIGAVDEIYVDDDTGEPAFALVKSGFLGTSSHFVPIQAATREGGALRVPYEKGVVNEAPGVAADGHLSRDEEAALYRHYGLDYGQGGSAEGEDGPAEEAVADEGAAPPAAAGADDAMTRSEEELRVVGHETRPRERVRLRKHQVTEYVTMRVPVTREEVRVEREPADASDADGGDEDGADGVTLMSEEPVVEKQVVPKERLRLEKEAVTEPQEVSGTVRKERVELERDDPDAGREDA